MMAFAEFMAAALLLTAVSCGAHPSVSAEAEKDQYHRAAATQAAHPPLHLAAEATDRQPLARRQSHFGEKTADSREHEQHRNSRLLIPYLHTQSFAGPATAAAEKPTGQSRGSSRTRRQSESRISKRSYYPYQVYSYQVPYYPPYQSISQWQPPVYQLSRPYYVPIYGIDGRIPIYYPPQPVYWGPPQNSRPPYVGPSYLPPTEATPILTPSPPPMNMSLPNRFWNDDDDKPVWDSSNDVTPQPPKAIPTSTVPTSVSPTRAASRPGFQTTHPPLIHNGGGSSNGINELSSGGGFRPPAAQQRPLASSSTQAPVAGPTRCVWAIISCCSTTADVAERCFEELGCQGPFWDRSPCQSDFAQAAIADAMKFYQNSK